ncbi:MAG: hypothetical protein AAFR59_20095, partial [Bacteroidota bacterium]
DFIWIQIDIRQNHLSPCSSFTFEAEVISYPDTIETDIWVHQDIMKDDKIKEAFYLTLDDLVEGRLPLGGQTAKGHGIFTGSYNPPRNHDKQ